MIKKGNFENRDCRKFIFLIVFFYYIVFFIFNFIFDANIMKLQGIPVTSPPFADMLCITSAQDSIRNGFDPLIENPNDPWGRPLNYPRIWQTLKFLNVSKDHSVVIGVILAIIFYFLIISLVPPTDTPRAILWIFLILSPAVTLAVERGNNDLVAFIFLCLALFGFSKETKLSNIFSYMLVLFAAIVKLFPIFAFLVLLKENRKIFIILLLFFAVIFTLYLGFSYDDLKMISRATPMGSKYAYGNKVIFDYIDQNIANKIFNVNIFPNKPLLAWAAALSLLITIFIYSVFYNKETYQNRNNIDSFRMGAGIYIGTFFLGNNWDYRLIFLLFTIPQLTEWELDKPRNLASKAIWLIIISLWSFTWLKIIKLPYNLNRVLDESFNWMLFGILLYFLIISFPHWIKTLLFFNKKELNGIESKI